MFYDTFHKLCESKGVTDSRACLEMGFSRSYAAKMKNKSGTPSIDKLAKMAEYFGVTTDYLLNGGQKESPASVTADGVDELDREALDIIHQLPPEKQAAALAMLRGLLSN